MGNRIYIATNKASGVSYRYTVRESWGKNAYTCEMGFGPHLYFSTLKLARENAERLGVLSVLDKIEV